MQPLSEFHLSSPKLSVAATMGISGHKKLRSFLQSCLVGRGDRAKFQDDESLFVSGRLDLLAITSVINYLEQKYYIDFSDASFDVELIDSVQAIESFVNGKASVLS